MAGKKRTLLYEKAEYLQPGSFNLQAMLKSATGKEISEREQANELDGTRMVLSGVHDSDGMLVAKLMLYTPGQKQKFLEYDAKNKDYKLDSLEMPTAKAASRREFVESLLYLAVLDNHVLLIGSHALRSLHLEKHLNWLLRHTNALAQENLLILANQRSASAITKIKRNPVKSIEISGEVDFDVLDQVPTKRRTKDNETVPGHKLLRPIGELADAASAIFGPIFGDASLKSALKRKEHFGLKMELQYRNRRKTTEGFELMDALATAGRHLDDVDCVLHLEGGGSLRGDEIKVTHPMTVSIHGDGRIEEPKIWQDMRAWLRSSIASNVVNA